MSALSYIQIHIPLVSNLNLRRIFLKFEFLFHEDSQYTGVWTYCAVCLKVD